MGETRNMSEIKKIVEPAELKLFRNGLSLSQQKLRVRIVLSGRAHFRSFLRLFRIIYHCITVLWKNFSESVTKPFLLGLFRLRAYAMISASTWCSKFAFVSLISIIKLRKKSKWEISTAAPAIKARLCKTAQIAVFRIHIHRIRIQQKISIRIQIQEGLESGSGS